MTVPHLKLLKWDEKYSVGIASVDHEHRELIALINILIRHISVNPPDVEVMEYLGDIQARIAAHFALEEKIMREARYDQYEDHKQDHDRLLEEIRDIMDEYEDESIFDERAFVERLDRWFSEHFRTKDARLHRMLHV